MTLNHAITESQAVQLADTIYLDVYGDIDDKYFKAEKLDEIETWLLEGDPNLDYSNVLPLIAEWREYDADEIERRIARSQAAATLGRAGGSVTSDAKAAAARENGKRGGYPKGQPRMTRTWLEKWIGVNRPDLGLFEAEAGIKGFYRRDADPAASFQGCGKTWKDVAARLGAIRVPDKA